MTMTSTTKTATAPALLSVTGLHAGYGKAEVLSGLNLTLPAGSVVTVIGPNGAGKSTTLNALMGVLPSSGHIDFDGHVQRAANVEKRVIQGLALVPEKRDLFGEMSVEDNLLLGAFQRFRKGHRDQAQTMEEVFALFPRLAERRSQAAATMSGGERQMLAIGRALMGKPKLLMLDEPSLGLAPLIVREIFRIISGLRDRGVSILLVEQNARAALQVADYAYVLEMGAVAMQGPARELADDPRVVEAYLGLGSKHQAMLST